VNGLNYIQQPIAESRKRLPLEPWGSTQLVQSFEQTVVGTSELTEKPTQGDWASIEQNLTGVATPATLFPYALEKQSAPEFKVRITEPRWAQVEQNLAGVSVPTTSYRPALEQWWEAGTNARLHWAQNLTGVCLPTEKLSQYALAQWWEAGTDLRFVEPNWDDMNQNPYWEQFNQKFLTSSILEALQDAYVIVDRDEVAPFIEQNQLTSILKEARGPLVAAFGQVTVKTLTIVEDDEGARTLFCLIMYPGDMQEARQALKAFDNNWWLQRSNRFASKLNFDFELI
jgi:hypothetical protein